MRCLLASLMLALCLVSAPAIPAEPTPGKITGGQRYDLPSWFKISFLDIREDLREAVTNGRQLMIFFHLDECPYCARTLDENFREGDTREFTEKNFDVVALNIRGDRTVEWIDGKTYTESSLTKMLRIYATPAIIFIDPECRIALRLDGFRKRQTLRHALEYVQQKAYRSESLASFITKQKQEPYRLRPEPMFQTVSNFKNYRKPLAVIFEDSHCTDCDEFHDRVLKHPEVAPELAKFLVVRLDADSDQPITDIQGKPTTPKRWAEQLKLSYRPGVVLFNEGRERARIDGMLYHFHFKEMLRYISGKHYKQYDSFSRYNAARRPELLKQGVTIDYAP